MSYFCKAEIAPLPYMVCENINNVRISQECTDKQEAANAVRHYKKIIAARRYHKSSFLTPHSSLLIPHSTNEKVYKKLIKFFDK